MVLSILYTVTPGIGDKNYTWSFPKSLQAKLARYPIARDLGRNFYGREISLTSLLKRSRRRTFAFKMVI